MEKIVFRSYIWFCHLPVVVRCFLSKEKKEKKSWKFRIATTSSKFVELQKYAKKSFISKIKLKKKNVKQIGQPWLKRKTWIYLIKIYFLDSETAKVKKKTRAKLVAQQSKVGLPLISTV